MTERRREERRGKAPAFQFYARDWLIDTARMSLEQEGAFIRLLGHQWIEGPLPADTAELARILGVGKRKFASLWRTLCKHFPAATPDTIANERLEEEREKQAQFREKMAEAGSRSAERRRNVGSTNVQPKRSKKVNLDPTLQSANYVTTSASPPAETPEELRPRGSWNTEFGVAWKARCECPMDSVPWSRITKAIKPLRAEHKDSEILFRWERYLSRTDLAYLSPERFAQTFGEWAAKKYDNYARGDEIARQLGEAV